MIEIRCPNCGKLLFMAESTSTRIELPCPKCKVMVRWPSLKAEIISAKTEEEDTHAKTGRPQP